jgi:chitinase
MIKNVIELLSLSDYYGVSERVDIAKGKNELPNGWKDAFRKIKRHNKTNRKVVTWTSIWDKIKNTYGRKN